MDATATQTTTAAALAAELAAKEQQLEALNTELNLLRRQPPGQYGHVVGNLLIYFVRQIYLQGNRRGHRLRVSASPIT